jgi:uncharacterized protein (TIGR03435 family)
MRSLRRTISIIYIGAVVTALLMYMPRAAGQAAAQPQMSKGADPSFEVAAIKPSSPEETGDGFHSDGRHISAENEPVESIMMVAYGVQANQVVGGPPWIADRRFDINGLADTEGEPSLEQMQGMYRKLLADRFHLILHHEKRELPVYAVQLVKGGPRLAASTADAGGSGDENASDHGGERTVRFSNANIADFILNMQFMVGRPMVDQTGLEGRFDFVLRFTPDEANAVANSSPGLFTAVQEQLGLKLEPVKAPVDVLVIDHVEMPSEN